MNVDRIGFIVIVLWRAVRLEKVSDVKLKPLAKTVIELTVECDGGDALECCQVVAGVKIIDPLLRRTFTVGPGTVLGLPHNRKPCRCPRVAKEARIARVFIQTREERSSQKIGIVYLFAVSRRVAETYLIAVPGNVKSLIEEFRGIERRVQVPIVLKDVVAVEERIACKGRADDIRLPTRHKRDAILPGEVIAPAHVRAPGRSGFHQLFKKTCCRACFTGNLQQSAAKQG